MGYDAAFFKCGGEVGDGNVVAVCQEEGDDFSWVGVEPFFDDDEVVAEEAGVFHEAGGVA